MFESYLTIADLTEYLLWYGQKVHQMIGSLLYKINQLNINSTK